MIHTIKKLAVIGLLAAVSSAAVAVEQIPVEDFFKRSPFTSFQLSPNGKYLAAVTPINERRNIAVIEELLTTRAGSNVGIVAHGGVLESIFRYVARLPLDHPRCIIAGNASLSIVAHGNYYGTFRWVIETWGDVAHLNGIGHYLGLA